MSMNERTTRLMRESAVVLFGSIAAAGLCASTTSDLQGMTPYPINSSLILPGLILLGALVTLAINDAMRSAVALLIIAVCGATMFGLAIAAPGFRVEGVRVMLIDRGTTYGLLGLLLIALFGLCGMVLAWALNAIFRPGSL